MRIGRKGDASGYALVIDMQYGHLALDVEAGMVLGHGRVEVLQHLAVREQLQGGRGAGALVCAIRDPLERCFVDLNGN